MFSYPLGMPIPERSGRKPVHELTALFLSDISQAVRLLSLKTRTQE